jgi:hypothetical protein
MANYNHSHDHKGGIMNNSMQTGLQINLKDAIEDVGGFVPESACLWQYPEIIRKNLSAKTVNHINLKGKDVINIYKTTNDGEDVYNISTIYDTSNIERPIYSDFSTIWSDEMSVDQVFTDLFNNILPAVRGVHAGDMTVTDESGVDTKKWVNTLFNKSGYKNGLNASSKYLRLYMTHQAEPLYIYINSVVDDLTKVYNAIDSDTVEFELDNANMTMKAHVSYITNEQITNLK